MHNAGFVNKPEIYLNILKALLLPAACSKTWLYKSAYFISIYNILHEIHKVNMVITYQW